MERKTITLSLLFAGCWPFIASAQHYVPGTAGILDAALLPPGFYFEDGNYYQWADHVAYPPSTAPYSAENRTQVYLNEPRLLWMTGAKILGADYGIGLMVPFKWVQTEYHGYTLGIPSGEQIIPSTENRAGLADLEFDPLLLAWHPGHFDITAGYGFWAPTGGYSVNHNANLGEGFWSQMITLGGAWHPDAEKTWAMTVLNHFEFNWANSDSRVPDRLTFSTIGRGPIPVFLPGSPPYTLGPTYTLEWSATKTVLPHLELGGIGYYQKQMSDNTGGDQLGPIETVALGPQIRSSWPKSGFTVTLSYDCELYAASQAPAKLLALSMAKSF